MDMKIADIPLLSKHLQEDWAMPTVSFWRDFAAERDLSTTRPYFIGIINGLAKRDICQTEGWGNLAPEEISKQIDRINRWAADNANKTDQQLHWESLQDLVAAGKG